MDNSFSVSEFVDYVNQTLDYAYNSAVIVGEVSSFKVNQGKWVFFDLKDEESSISCFMPAWELRTELEDGMKVVVRGIPKITKWGKFSFTVKNVQPVGEGNIKKAFELLKRKLAKEGLFAPEKKRPLPKNIEHIGVISSTQAAGYADFIKIVNERWGGLKIHVAHTGVQGLQAADQIVRALKYLNEHAEVQIIAIIRGGGSADDLAVFNDEQLVRAIAGSRIPVITGIGHEVDESLSDLAADLRGSTPSNVAQILTPDRRAESEKLKNTVFRLKSPILEVVRVKTNETDLSKIGHLISERLASTSISIDTDRLHNLLFGQLENETRRVNEFTHRISTQLKTELSRSTSDISEKIRLLDRLNPENVLKQGYAIVGGKLAIGESLNITTLENLVTAKVITIKERKENG